MERIATTMTYNESGNEMIHFMQQTKFTQLVKNDDFIAIKTLTNLVRDHL
jgi:hypothetical protein